MDSSKAPVKLVKVTRVLGRTGMRNPRRNAVKVDFPARKGDCDGRKNRRRHRNADHGGFLQALAVVLPRSASSSWTTRPAPSSVTSRALVKNSPFRLYTNTHTARAAKTNKSAQQSVRTTSLSFSSPSVRPAVSVKKFDVTKKGGMRITALPRFWPVSTRNDFIMTCGQGITEHSGLGVR